METRVRVSVASRLKELNAEADAGLLTAAEFAAAKQDLLQNFVGSIGEGGGLVGAAPLSVPALPNRGANDSSTSPPPGAAFAATTQPRAGRRCSLLGAGLVALMACLAVPLSWLVPPLHRSNAVLLPRPIPRYQLDALSAGDIERLVIQVGDHV
jgi:hypothetical protein